MAAFRGLLLFYHCCLIVRVTAISLDDFYAFGSGANDRNYTAVDDGSSPPVVLQTLFPFFDDNQGTVYINSNGIISFGEEVTAFEPEPFPLPNFKVIAPFWADVDTTGIGTVWYRVTSDAELLHRAKNDVLQNPILFPDVDLRNFFPTLLLIATWDHVGYFDQQTDKTNTFQCVMVTDGQLSFVIFLYAEGEIQWTTGDFNGGFRGLGGSPANVGFNAGDGVRFANIPSSQTDDIVNIDETLGNSGTKGVWIFRVDGIDVHIITPGNCTDIGLLNLQPPHGNILGGTLVTISGPCFDDSQDIWCQFGSTELVPGSYLNERQAVCISPILQEIGNVKFALTILKEQQVVYQRSNVSFYSLSFSNAHQVNFESESLLFAPGSAVTLTWDPQAIYPPESLGTYTLDIQIYTLRESSEWNKLANLASNISNSGTAVVTIPVDLSNKGLGIIIPVTFEVSANVESLMSIGAPGVWSSVAYIAISPNAVTREQCEVWFNNTAERQMERNIIDSLPPCPCTEQQARSPNSGVCEQNLANPTQLFFNSGASTCFYPTRLAPVFPSSRQCCYDEGGNIIIGPGGGHSDSFSPNAQIGLSPHASFWLHFQLDIIPFIQCCKAEFSICKAFYDHRPIFPEERFTQCQLGYSVPALVIGDPHIVTLDGLEYTFNGRGEFTLIQTTDSLFTVQGRMIAAKDQNGNPVSATLFSAVVAEQSNSDTVQFEVSRRGIDMLVNGERVNFRFQELELGTVILKHLGNDKYGAVFPSGAYIVVERQLELLKLLVSLPSSFMNSTQGLMGLFNGDTVDDLLPRHQSAPIPPNSSLQCIHEAFGLSWILEEETLFTYRPGESSTTFFDPRFAAELEPLFVDQELESRAMTTCGDDRFCLFDIAVTGRVEVGQSTFRGNNRLRAIRAMSAPAFCTPPCQNGICIANGTCSCQVGYEGERCKQAALQDECDINICLNGGTCQRLAEDYICTCPPFSTGLTCEQQLPLKVQFINSSPRLSGSTITADFTVNTPGVPVTCYLTQQQSKDCSSGRVSFSELAPGRYTLRVVAKASKGQRAVIRRTVHIGFCSVYLINEGRVVIGHTATIQFLGTGGARSYSCRLNNGSFYHCRSPVRLLNLEPGRHRLIVVPEGCSGIQHRLSVNLFIE